MSRYQVVGIVLPSFLAIVATIVPSGPNLDVDITGDSVTIEGSEEHVITEDTSLSRSSFTYAENVGASDYVTTGPASPESSKGVVHCAGVDDPEVYFQVWNACQEPPAEPVAPGGPQPAARPGGKRVVTVTRSQVARLLVGGSGITRQPPSLNTRLGMPLIVYTNPRNQPRTAQTRVGPAEAPQAPQRQPVTHPIGARIRSAPPYPSTGPGPDHGSGGQ